MVAKIAIGLLALALGGCQLAGQIGPAVQDIEDAKAQLILSDHAAQHNLAIGILQIDQQPGMVTMTMPPPVVTPNAPVVMPAPPAPTPVPSMPIPTRPTSNG